MKLAIVILITTSILSCNRKEGAPKVEIEKVSAEFSEIETIVDGHNNIVMTKSGIANLNNTRTFKYYDTTRRLVLVIEWGGLDSIRRIISPQQRVSSMHTTLAGRCFYEEYLLGIFGQQNNFRSYLENELINNTRMAFDITDSIIFENYKFHLLKSEFENLQQYLN